MNLKSEQLRKLSYENDDFIVYFFIFFPPKGANTSQINASGGEHNSRAAEMKIGERFDFMISTFNSNFTILSFLSEEMFLSLDKNGCLSGFSPQGKNRSGIKRKNGEILGLK